MLNFKKLDFTFDPEKLQEALKQVNAIVEFPKILVEKTPMKKEIYINSDKICHQLCLTKRKGDIAPNYYYVQAEQKGEVKKYDNTIENSNWEKDENHKEFEYTELIPEFRETYFKDVYEKISAWAKTHDCLLGRARLRLSHPYTCLSWHQDDQPNIHIPIITNKSSRIVIEDEMLHMPAGEVWFANVTERHTQFNAGHNERIHLVVSIKHKEFKSEYEKNKNKTNIYNS